MEVFKEWRVVAMNIEYTHHKLVYDVMTCCCVKLDMMDSWFLMCDS